MTCRKHAAMANREQSRNTSMCMYGESNEGGKEGGKQSAKETWMCGGMCIYTYLHITPYMQM